VTTFLKHDQGKPRPSLLPFRALARVVDVLEYGARKYAPGNWRRCEDMVRYDDAALRHLLAHMGGEWLDPGTKLPHLAHAICCLMFRLELTEVRRAAQAEDEEEDPLEKMQREAAALCFLCGDSPCSKSHEGCP
jgi:hypothetical protein